MAYKRTEIRIPSATPGWNLDAWKYIPTGIKRSSPCPVIILAHGLSANKLLGLDEYAERYAAEGYACVVFDYRRWGSSDGTPRHVLKVSEQLEDYRTVVKWARQTPEFDARRIVLWGASFSGGHIMQLASEDSDLAAAMGQCAYAGSAIRSNGRPLSSSFRLLKLVSLAIIDVLKQYLGFEPYYRLATSEPGAGGILDAPGAGQGLASLAKDPSHSPNQINASCIFEVRLYKPHLVASSITCPLLLVVPESDNICSITGALDAFSKAKKGELVRTQGGHFDVYPRHVGFDKAIQSQLAFLQKHVPVLE